MFDQLIFPTDGSDTATVALGVGIDVANAAGAALHVLSVVDTEARGIDVRTDIQTGEFEGSANRIVEEATRSAEEAGVGSMSGAVERECRSTGRFARTSGPRHRRRRSRDARSDRPRPVRARECRGEARPDVTDPRADGPGARGRGVRELRGDSPFRPGCALGSRGCHARARWIHPPPGLTPRRTRRRRVRSSPAASHRRAPRRARRGRHSRGTRS